MIRAKDKNHSHLKVKTHNLKLLVIDGADEDVRAEWFAGDSRGEQIFALVVVAVIDEDLGNILDFISTERSPVVEFA